MMTKPLVRLGITCLSFGLLACEGDRELIEISSTQAALTAAENSERALRGVLDAAEFLTASASISETLSVMFGSREQCDSEAVYCSDVATCPPPTTTCTSTGIEAADLEEGRQELREAAQDFVRQLRERVLIPENLEAETSTSATYRLDAAALCGEDEDADSGTEADCADDVARFEPRVVLTSSRAGDIDVTILLGSARRAPLSLQMYQHSLGVRLDLGEAYALATDFGEDLDGVRQLEGLLELSLVEHGPRDYGLEFSVLERLAVVMDSQTDTLSASLSPSSPTWNVRVDGEAQSLSAGIDLGAFELAGPLSAFADMFTSEDIAVSGAGGAPSSADAFAPEAPEVPEYSGIVEMFLAGLSSTVTYTAASDVLKLTDIGVGNSTSTIKHDGRTLLGLDLNAAHGRRVALEVTPLAEGAQITITPTLDLRLALAFEHVADQIEGIADSVLNDTLRVWFDGEEPVVESSEGALRVVSGTLHVESSAEPAANVVADAGMCVIEASTDDESHWLASLEVTTCE